MSKRKMPFPILLGIILIGLSLLFMLGFQMRMMISNQKCQQIATQMAAILPERSQGVVDASLQMPMPALELDGQDYVALLEVPAYGLTLPVTNQWNTDTLLSLPGRFWGSVYDGPLVIGGADDPRQFGFCATISHGTPIFITDMTGARFSYEVVRIDRADHAQSQWLMKPEYDLTIFCRDAYSLEYIAVRCVFSYRSET